MRKRFIRLGLAGTMICMVADLLLGAYKPSNHFGSLAIFPEFSEEWADVNPMRFSVSAFLVIIAMALIFCGLYGIYEQMKTKQVKEAKIFLGASAAFCFVGMFYHGVFAMTAYLYNQLKRLFIPEAEQIAEKFFGVFICVTMMAAVGFLLSCGILFEVAIRGKFDNKRSFAIVNPLVFMLVLVVLSALLPQTALVNGVCGWGQQSVSLFMTFIIYDRAIASWRV